MGLQDREWYQNEVKRKSGTPAGDVPPRSEFARLLADKDSSRTGRPWWLAEWIRVAIFFGVIAVLYYAWTQLKG